MKDKSTSVPARHLCHHCERH